MKLVFALLGTTALATATLAGSPDRTPGTVELRKDFLPADTTQVVHLDVGRFRKTTLGTLLVQNKDSFELDEYASMEEELGFDPLTALYSVTAYGAGDDDGPSTVLVVATEAIDSAIVKASEEEDLERVSVDGLNLFAMEGAYLYVAKIRGTDRVVVVAEELEAVVRGARVVRGEARNLADAGDSALPSQPIAGSFLHIAATELSPMRDFEPASQVFGLAQGIQFDFGEAGGSVFAHLAVSTESIENARSFVQIVQGVLAIAQLSMGSEGPEGVMDLIGGIQVNSRGNMVSLDFEYAVDALVAMLLEASGEGGR